MTVSQGVPTEHDSLINKIDVLKTVLLEQLGKNLHAKIFLIGSKFYIIIFINIQPTVNAM